MHCDKCKTIIDKGVIIAEAIHGTENKEGIETLYCKKCFKQEFTVNE